MKVEIKVDGVKIPANKFVQEIFAGMLEGVICKLKKVEPNWRRLEILVEKEDEGSD
ncbi:MAG: hypothetical protein QXJ68_04170 [Methanocellales archaeon]